MNYMTEGRIAELESRIARLETKAPMTDERENWLPMGGELVIPTVSATEVTEASVYRELDSTDEKDAHTDEWTIGDKEVPDGGESAVPCGVKFLQNRTYYDNGDDAIYEYPREVRYNENGALVYVGPEVKRAIANVEPEGD